MSKTSWRVVLVFLLASALLAIFTLTARGSTTALAATSTRWPTVTRRSTDTRWPVAPTSTRWPTVTLRPTNTRWPTIAPRSTDTRWPVAPTNTRWPTVVPSLTSTRWPTVVPSLTSTRWPTVIPSLTSTHWPTVVPSPTSTRWPSPTSTSGLSMGPFGVVMVKANEVLNIRSGAGTGYSIVGSFNSYDATVMREGSILPSGGATWYRVQKPGGGTGWVNAYYLSEYVTSGAFCSDARIQSLFIQLQQAVNTSDGALFASLVSPVRGVDVRYWHYGQVINYTPAQAAGVFTSTVQQNWGGGPSGINTVGTFAGVIQPTLVDVLNASYSSFCNDPQHASMFAQPWPDEYININYYSLVRPGTPGVDLDYQQWMVGFDYVRGKPYIVSMIRIVWEP